MLCIDHLRMRLPPGYEHRAGGIAREVAQLLAALDSRSLRATETLRLPAVGVASGGSDREVAAAIAEAISAGLRRPR